MASPASLLGSAHVEGDAASRHIKVDRLPPDERLFVAGSGVRRAFVAVQGDHCQGAHIGEICLDLKHL